MIESFVALEPLPTLWKIAIDNAIQKTKLDAIENQVDHTTFSICSQIACGWPQARFSIRPSIRSSFLNFTAGLHNFLWADGWAQNGERPEVSRL